jgi:hypothetical protein
MATQGYKRYIYEDEFLAPKNYTVLIDTETGYEYIVEMSGGKLTTRCKVVSISASVTGTVVLGLDKVSGITVYGILQDGTKVELKNYTITNIDVTTIPNKVDINYTDIGDTFTTSISVEPELSLIDFEFTVEENGTYTLTGWKGTYNGEPSTEIIIPSSKLINL